MLKSKKKVINLVVLRKLVELFPDMTVTELLKYFEYCEIIKSDVGLNTIGVADRGDN